MQGISQLALNLVLPEDTTLTNYYGARNRELLSNLHKTSCGRGERLIYFWGGKGVGKTHLLQACCNTANRLGLMPLYLPLSKLEDLNPTILEDLETLHLVCIDDIQNIAGHEEWEEAFFSFFNRMHEAKKRLIIASTSPAQKLNIILPDLVSRLSGSVIYQVQELTDDEKIEALIYRSRSKGIEMPLKVAQYLYCHCERDMKSLFEKFAVLDRASLAAQHKLTVPFVKEVLGI